LNKILDQIVQPGDLRQLSLPQLTKLAGEIRELLVQTISETGGHLAPNLGVVELTLALHKVFNSPQDKIVWDVGHQCYIHKILTGRKDAFCKIRTLGGISGFPKRSESEHDSYGTGHSSTSISAALGMAFARDIKKEKHAVLAVIGDGSLTGGMAYEALNNAGNAKTSLTVILNDNEMSIAKNVGAMSEYLAQVRSTPAYTKVKRDVEYLLRSIPSIGDRLADTVERVKDSLKYLVVPGMLFEELGFTYMGPIDGHNLNSLIEVLQQSKNILGPVLIHVITHKGKGYLPAERSAAKFHGVGPFCIETGEIKSSGGPKSYTSVFGDTLVELAEKNPEIIAITAAMPDGTGLNKFSKAFPKRFFDVGIAEQHAVTMAGGMATQGLKPVVAIYSTFLQRGYDLILHDLCLQKLPVVLAIDRAGLVGEDGPTHHGVFDLSFLRHMPNLMIMAPKDENELRHMLKTALDYHKGPVAIRYPRGSGLGVSMEEPVHVLEIGCSEELKIGKQVTFLAVGTMVDSCREATELLAEQGISAGVVNMRFIKPLDGQMIRKAAKEVGIIVTVEENVLAGGFGSAVLEYIDEQHLNWVKVLRLGLPDQFIEQGARSKLLQKYQLDSRGIASQVADYLQEFGVK
jgi:1-deoxy-D-xylulose-5-phosphate synthase